MAERKYAVVFLDDGNCEAWWVLHEPSVGGSGERVSAGYRSGLTERNIGELVKALTGLGYHVTLYRVSAPEFHAPEAK